MHGSIMDCFRLSPHFTLDEFLNVRKYPDNKPSLQHVANMTYGCLMLLEPARKAVGPIRLHISWNPFGPPRHDVRIGYYK